VQSRRCTSADRTDLRFGAVVEACRYRMPRSAPMADLIAIAAHRKTSYDHPATHLLIQPPSGYTPRFAAPRGIGSSAPIPYLSLVRPGSLVIEANPLKYSVMAARSLALGLLLLLCW
jgi:hypothetical protein